MTDASTHPVPDTAPEVETRAAMLIRPLYCIAIAFSLFQLYTAVFTPLSSLVVRSVHVGFLILLALTLYRANGSGQNKVPWYDWALGLTGFALGFYHWIFEADIMLRFLPETQDLIVGTLMVALVFEGARRCMGIGLAVVCGLFLLWGLFGQYLPEPLGHRGYAPDQVLQQLFLGTEGIFGIPTFVSSTYLFLFILFGSFLQQAGMVGLFNDLSLGTVGHTKGGPAKVAVVSSGIMGTISGSGIANVVTTGLFTIPLMKRFGYRPAFAGAVEATASMGGQIMPPVMGAVAFIMAETIGAPYVDVVKAAAIPAVLYFATVLWMVHLEAGRCNLKGLPKAECPRPLLALKERWYLLLPLMTLVWLLFGGYTPLFAGTIGLLLTVVLILGSALSGPLRQTYMKVAFWIMVGLACSAFFKYGAGAIFALIGVLILPQLILKGGRDTLKLCLDSLAQGAVSATGVGIACAVVGVIIAILTLTGLPITIGSAIVDIGQSSLFLSLVLTMLTCIVLGMGIPSIPNYIITSSIAGPVLVQLGVPVIVAHMFVFYFGIMANLTPPVALAAFAAAPIANAPAMRISMICLRIAIAGFLLPFMAVYAPALMLQGDSLLMSAWVTFKAVFAIALWGAAAIGYLYAPLNWPERLWATAAAGCMVVAMPITDEIGLALGAAFLAWHWFQVRRGNSLSTEPV
ncbi:TRAP transporter permease [Marinobacterium stanieri]|uniref:TRAP transporter, 4TM/12TM fusion protein n=1 Tax=Marinobacterium stanieri TaxID=49186 RepID=A0A1N6S3M4_9GAMM|nr:TRAP transporter permease [Marinobacterium stanieri]SIQ35748.1 TRAP transporter, 4TM/12TM fusion protein [Marinobacterium stanieri]